MTSSSAAEVLLFLAPAAATAGTGVYSLGGGRGLWSYSSPSPCIFRLLPSRPPRPLRRRPFSYPRCTRVSPLLLRAPSWCREMPTCYQREKRKKGEAAFFPEGGGERQSEPRCPRQERELAGTRENRDNTLTSERRWTTRLLRKITPARQTKLRRAQTLPRTARP